MLVVRQEMIQQVSTTLHRHGGLKVEGPVLQQDSQPVKDVEAWPVKMQDGESVHLDDVLVREPVLRLRTGPLPRQGRTLRTVETGLSTILSDPW